MKPFSESDNSGFTHLPLPDVQDSHPEPISETTGLPLRAEERAVLLGSTQTVLSRVTLHQLVPPKGDMI